jgi:hypothetical protein
MNTKLFRWVVVAVAVLAVVNIALVAIIWMQQKRPQSEAQRPHDARELLVKELAMNSNQVKVFDSLRKIHFKEMDNYRNEMHELKDSFFSRLDDSTYSPDSTAGSIGRVQSKIELSTYNHFAELRNILDKNQQEKFDGIIQDVLRNMGPGVPDGHGGPPPGERHSPREEPPPGASPEQ